MNEDLDLQKQPSNDGSGTDAGEPPSFLAKLPAAVRNPFVFAAPHSGRHYPQGFHLQSKLDARQLRLSEDAFVDDLFEGVTGFGGTQLVATHARSFVDLNRDANELEPGMFSGDLGDYEVDLNNRVKAGLGVVPRIIGEGMPIYDGLIPAREAFKRLDDIYRPYHNTLKNLLLARHKQFGASVLIDCHSMPSGPELGRRLQAQPDIILGDCWGTSCSRDVTSMAERLFLEAGFKVRRNVPYAGGYATRHYGAPARNCHALQIEINRSLYMDEKKVAKLDHFGEIQQRLEDVCRAMVQAFSGLHEASFKKAAE